MSKTIKLTDTTYYWLEDYRHKRETFDQAIARLLDQYSIAVTLAGGTQNRALQIRTPKTKKEAQNGT